MIQELPLPGIFLERTTPGVFKLCNSRPYKEEVFESFSNIWALAVPLE